MALTFVSASGGEQDLLTVTISDGEEEYTVTGWVSALTDLSAKQTKEYLRGIISEQLPELLLTPIAQPVSLALKPGDVL